MSVPAASPELRAEVERYGPVAFLVTVAPGTRRPHVVSVAVRWEGDALVSGAGSQTAANVREGADVSLVWSPPQGDSYSLIVDGPADVVEGADGFVVSIRATRSVRHRMADAAGDGPGCIPVATPPTTGPPTTGPPTTGPPANGLSTNGLPTNGPPANGLPADNLEAMVDDREHPNAVTVRRFLNAWFDGDFATWLALAADDIVIHMRGKPSIDGSYHGQAGVMTFFERFAAVSVESFELEVEDVIADDRYAMAILRTEYHRGDDYLPLRNACAYRLNPDGRIAMAWNVSDSQIAERAFFTLSEADAAPGAPGPG